MAHLELLGPVARIGLAILLNGLWQGALIAFLTWAALNVFRSANAATRYAVWSLALLAVLVVPVVTSLSRVSVEPAATTKATTTSASSYIGQSTHAPRTRSHMHSAPATTASTVAASQPAPRFTLPTLHVKLPDYIAPALFALWLLASLVIFVRLIVAFLALERLKHDSLPLSVEYRDSMPRWMNALKGSRDVRICVSDAIEVPIAVGLFDSMVLLPSHLVHSLDPSEIDQISLHELGHLLRSDDWTNAIQRIACALLFFNPAVWFISRQMDVEREVACDDYVLQLTGAVRPYAFCLTKMAEMTAWPHRPMPAPGVFVTRKNISIRIERLLRTGRAIGSSIAPSVAGSFVAALVAVFIVLRTMTPSIAFTTPAVADVPAAPSPAPVAHFAPVEKIAVKKTENIHVRIAATAPAIKVAAVTTVAQPSAAPTVPPVSPPSHKTYHPVANTPKMPSLPHMVAQTRSSDVSVDIPDIGATVQHALKTAGIAAAHAHETDGCTGCNFSNANLSGRDFSNRSMEGANFRDANLQGARFDHTQMTGANFTDADLRNASFRDADLEGCNMRGARLEGVNFDGARLTGCNIDVTKLSPQQARNVLNSCEGCNFANVNLSGMDLHGIHLTGVNLSGADLRNTNLSGAELTGANLVGAKLAGANLNNADLTGCNLRGADLRGVDLSHTSLTGANMGDAIWKD